MKIKLAVVTWLFMACATGRAGPGILVEAESFADKGGWSVDPQFVEQMGSPYLLAHGLGKPVANASTRVAIGTTGVYRVWVRTRNWAPGDWEAPGRFKVLLNGRALDPEFGILEGWTWQDGGTATLPAGDLRIELQDLTGFDGRCDALFLSPDPAVRPPDDLKAMTAWRNGLLGMPENPTPAGTFDVVVVGGGIAGCAAALAAAEQGLSVALVHDRPILGGNASGEVRVHVIGITGYADRLLKTINTGHWPNGSSMALSDDVRRHATLDAATGIRQFLSWRAYGVVTEGGRIMRVNARHIETGEARSFAAPAFIDATGDGWIGYWAGAQHRIGRESRDEFGEGWEEHGDLWSPAVADKRMMGVSLLWNSEAGPALSEFPDVPWATAVASTNAAVQGEWYWEYSDDRLDPIDQAEEIRDHMLRAIFGAFANAKKQSQFAAHDLKFVGYISGKRESRRLMGDYIYTLNDMTEGRNFPDAVATETREVDLHFQRQLKDPALPHDFLSTALFKKVPRYYIPFRSLYSTNIVNLMMAGRCFSCSHAGLGGPRVMNTCGQMGAATGYAAALMKKHGATPRGIYEKHLDELLRLVRPDPSAVNLDDGKHAMENSIDALAPGDPLPRVRGRFTVAAVPPELRAAVRVVPSRGDASKPGRAYRFTVNAPVDVFVAVHARGDAKLPAGWEKTGLGVRWDLGTDTVHRCRFPAGPVAIPGHPGHAGSNYGLPHLTFVLPAGPAPEGGLKITGAGFAE
ncbi:MAG: FAD-dependent oxidoreductase [Verrucomicrobia bacterium]|nr:FAD-dependent oxidoreductase [Verrucomicrobiota bacterium]